MHSQQFQVGADTVIVTGRRLFVFARHEIPEWTVREFSKVCIVFREQRYSVARRDSGPKPYAMKYELEEWKTTDLPNQVFYYDEDYVSSREAALSSNRSTELVALSLLPFYPLLGF